ncbi:phosphomethylpyrimidine synthase ThiC [Thermodesulfobacteriota bacterium]
MNHNFSPKGIGRGLRTKINAHIGTSPSHFDLQEELEKLDIAVKAGAEIPGANQNAPVCANRKGAADCATVEA